MPKRIEPQVKASSVRVGIDVGGTFTDFYVEDVSRDAGFSFKVPSTPSDPSLAILAGLGALLIEKRIDAGRICFLAHGTTVATNMILEHRGGPTALITTKGFGDVLEIGRQVRPHVYDYHVARPSPLIPRALRFEVEERIGADGQVVVGLTDDAVAALLATMHSAHFESIAVGLLHSYRNSEHEQRIGAAIREAFPGAFVSLSAEVLPELREYERLSTTVMNAYVGPRMAAYLSRLEKGLADLGIGAPVQTIHSNGGLVSVRTASTFPVRTCLSGPAAGVVGASRVAEQIGIADFITFDAGGTSTDVAIVHNRQPAVTSERLLGGQPIKVPMIDIQVIGAGGGSIAKLDSVGALKVGPESAGADPGPAAYQRGGDRATLTDANLYLGRLDPQIELAGGLSFSREAAKAVLLRRIAQPLGVDVAKAADGVLRIAHANMSRAIRAVSTERGFDLANFVLFAYGGGGPLHAAEVAQECGIPRVIVPRDPGTLCARGATMADVSLDFSHTIARQADEAVWGEVCDRLVEMRAEGSEWLARERVDLKNRYFIATIDAHYAGQSHDISVPVELDRMAFSDFVEQFAARHEQEYGYAVDGRAVGITMLRLKAVGRTVRHQNPAVSIGTSLGEAEAGTRMVHFSGRGFVETQIYRRSKMPEGVKVVGPAVFAEETSTVILPPGHQVEMDAKGNLVIDVQPEI